jgi:hypothetical protein
MISSTQKTRSWFEASSDKKLGIYLSLTNKLGVVVYIYYPSYVESVCKYEDGGSGLPSQEMREST